MEKLECDNCKHDWLQRVESPRQCPKCGTYSWKKKSNIKRSEKEVVK